MSLPAPRPLSILPPQVAGRHYPERRHELGEALTQALVSARSSSVANAKLVIAPLSPLADCGAVMASAFTNLANRRGLVRKVVVLGPARNVLRGAAIPTHAAMRTPLGAIPLDRRNLAALRGLVEVGDDDRGFEGEGAIEAVLPLLQACLQDFELTPVLIGSVYPHVVANILAKVWGGPETLIVVTSDLSHHLFDEKARAFDSETRGVIETLAADLMSTSRADGHRIIAGALLRAAALDLRVTGLDFRTSPTGTGRVRGHGAFVFEPAQTARLSAPERQFLLRTAAQSVRIAARSPHAGARPMTSARVPLTLSAIRAATVTLERDGMPRGGSGALRPYRALLTEVAARAAEAATGDVRFPPVRPEELEELTLSVSITSHARPLPNVSPEAALAALTPGRDGLVLEDRGRSAVAMPSMWGNIADPALLLTALRQKAGFSGDYWSPTISLKRFTAETFGAPLRDCL